MKHLGYMPAVDGLRTIAVTLVLLFHVDLKLFEGGFIGVDVFFVISGFLITGILVKSRDDFSFVQFYARRFRRLLPALFVTVLLSLLASAFISSTFELMRDGKQAMYSSGSLANILFWMESGYFDTDSKNKLFLHTWSLSVEEQFYLFWPALIMLSLKGGRMAVLVTVVALSAVTLAAGWYLNADHAGAVFFLTPFRVFQFGAGAILAILAFQVRGVTGNLVGVLATIALLAWSYVIHVIPGYYSITTVVPTLLTMAILACVSTPGVEKWLGSYPMVWLGQRSYSIYLVHWPLIVLWKRATDENLDGVEVTGLLLASVVFGALLHLFVEHNLRDRRNQPAYPWVTAVTAGGMVVSMFVGAHFWAQNGRVSAKSSSAVGVVSYDPAQIADDRVSKIRTGVCHLTPAISFEDWDRETCIEPGRNNWLLVGDSFAADTYLVFKAGKPSNVSFTQLTMRGCMPVLRSAQPKGEVGACLRYSDDWIEEAKSGKYAGVVMAGRWDAKGENAQIVRRTLDHLVENGVPAFVVGGRPIFPESVPEYLLTKNAKSVFSSSELRTRADELNKDIEAAIPPQNFIDFSPIQCPGEVCPLKDPSGWPLYSDGGHLSVYGFEYFGARMAEEQLFERFRD